MAAFSTNFDKKLRFWDLMVVAENKLQVNLFQK